MLLRLFPSALLGACLCTLPAQAEDPAETETVVTATRAPKPLREAPGTVHVINRTQIERTPARSSDALLRQDPSFATFRQTPSLVSDPTAQGANLRGVGPSGVSRTLVLLDGVPMNDPFGGWVYWRAMPLLSVGRVEVMPGGASALYGDAALGGVVQVLSRPIESREVDLTASLGLLSTMQSALRAADRWEKVAASIDAEFLSSDGYQIVSPKMRGKVDGRTPSLHGTFNAKVEAQPLSDLKLTLGGLYFNEKQNGGTRFTTAEVRVARLSLGGAWTPVGAGQLSFGLWGGQSVFEQERARLTSDRSSEVLSAKQETPAWNTGLSVVWRSPALRGPGVHELSAGLEGKHVQVAGKESLFPATEVAESLVRRDLRGQQQQVGVFVQDVVTFSPQWQASAALRWDGWRNADGALSLFRSAAPTTETRFPVRHDYQISPKLSVLFLPVEMLGLRIGAYQSFRAPTLNELYRPFQVGTILTDPNPALRSERLLGGEAAAELTAGPLWLQAVGFWNRLTDPITNVTLATPLPNGAQRQRQNLGAAEIPGAELNFRVKFAQFWTLRGGYTFVNPVVTEHPELKGKLLAQDPQHRGSLAVGFHHPDIVTATVQARVVGRAFEDDQNKLPINGFVLVDLFASRKLAQGFEAFLSIENLTNATYVVGRAGVDTIGPPITGQLGVKVATR